MDSGSRLSLVRNDDLFMTPEDRLQRIAWWLTLAGLLPFGWLTLEVLSGAVLLARDPLFALTAYGAVILSFLGGMYWMRALLLDGDAHLSGWVLGVSVMPALVGWAALLTGGADALLILIAGYLGMLGAERSFYGMGVLPAWFWKLRRIATALVVVMLAVVWGII